MEREEETNEGKETKSESERTDQTESERMPQRVREGERER